MVTLCAGLDGLTDLAGQPTLIPSKSVQVNQEDSLNRHSRNSISEQRAMPGGMHLDECQTFCTVSRVV